MLTLQKNLQNPRPSWDNGQEDPYFLELVCYIHLNPIRAKVLKDFSALDTYPYCGHSVILGKKTSSWQDIEYVLGQFDKRISLARKRYRIFVEAGLEMGRRPDLIGGGLIRSTGGWEKIKESGKGARLKGDERILVSKEKYSCIVRQDFR